jgi:hypothetical protein
MQNPKILLLEEVKGGLDSLCKFYSRIHHRYFLSKYSCLHSIIVYVVFRDLLDNRTC